MNWVKLPSFVGCWVEEFSQRSRKTRASTLKKERKKDTDLYLKSQGIIYNKHDPCMTHIPGKYSKGVSTREPSPYPTRATFFPSYFLVTRNAAIPEAFGGWGTWLLCKAERQPLQYIFYTGCRDKDFT